MDFAYNNGYHAFVKMSPFEYFYGRNCNTPISWDNPIDIVIVGIELLREMEEHMVKIRQNLKTTQDKLKSYAIGEKYQENLFEIQVEEEFTKAHNLS